MNQWRIPTDWDVPELGSHVLSADSGRLEIRRLSKRILLVSQSGNLPTSQALDWIAQTVMRFRVVAQMEAQ